ncbi:hypothetical protein [Novacetimonas hansenii]|uniref:hypothetical protein n=1 Tax=Novacetimonas hansenii TaxID=436 RepID=UPI001CE0C870|nr:hypothetical protein [Novacetimonas hansenii]
MRIFSVVFSVTTPPVASTPVVPIPVVSPPAVPPPAVSIPARALRAVALGLGLGLGLALLPAIAMPARSAHAAPAMAPGNNGGDNGGNNGGDGAQGGAQDAGWSFSPDGAQGQPMVISRQNQLDIMFYRSASGSLGMAVHDLHKRYRNPAGVTTAGVVIGKFELVMQIFSKGRKWDTAGGDMKPDAVADLMQQLHTVTTGNLVPPERAPVPFSVAGAANALSQMGEYAAAHALWMPPPLGPAAAPPHAAPPLDIEKLAHHPYDTQHGRMVALPHYPIAQNCARAHVEMQDSDTDCITAEQKSEAALSTAWAHYDSDLKAACLGMAGDVGRLEKYQALEMCLSRYQDDRRQWQLVSGSSGSDDIMPHDHPTPPPATP